MKNPTSIDIGQRIRCKRKEAGLTQSALCGDRITRNMLSRIETGDASPSLDTLLYLADRLKTPPAYFLCRDMSEQSAYDKAARIGDIRRLMSDGRYDKCAVKCNETQRDAEVGLALAICEAKSAFAAFCRSNATAAVSHCDKALSAVETTVYMHDALAGEIRLIKRLCQTADNCSPPHPNELTGCSFSIMGGEFFTYLLALSFTEINGEKGYELSRLLAENGIGREYINARSLISEEMYSDALVILESILSKETDYLTHRLAMKDAELCYYKTENYKAAYEMSAKRTHRSGKNQK